MSEIQLRDYQKEAVEAAWEAIRDRKNPCLSLPTGSGKSWIIAELCREAWEKWQGRSIVLAHRKELLSQNQEKIATLLPDTKVGLYSAGLDLRNTDSNVVVAGIQSVYKRAEEFGERHLLVIDECHRINPGDETTQYRQFISGLLEMNPWLSVIGLSATPYRTGEGTIVQDGGIFDVIAYEADIKTLIEQNYLCPITNQIAKSEIDLSGVDIRKGEFVQKQMEDMFLANVHALCAETVRATEDRKSIIVFCSGVDHAVATADSLRDLSGDEVGLITGETLPLERTATLEDFKSGELRWLVNVNVLTEGFDATRVDCVAMMRGTVSPGLFAQAVGRGLRMHEGVEDCLLLDFGGNLERHGALNDPEFGKRKKVSREEEEKREGPGKKQCPEDEGGCGELSPMAAVFCWQCGFYFKALTPTADEKSQVIQEPRWQHIDEVCLYVHRKKDNPDSRTLRVDYCWGDFDQVSEWVCIEHTGFAWGKACDWWSKHSITQMPDTIEEAISLWKQGALRMPRRIKVVKEGKFWKVCEREFDEDRPSVWDIEDAPF